MPSIPNTPADFAKAASSIALPWLAYFGRQGFPPHIASGLMVTALVEVCQQLVGPVATVEALRDAADTIEAMLLDQAKGADGE